MYDLPPSHEFHEANLEFRPHCLYFYGTDLALTLCALVSVLPSCGKPQIFHLLSPAMMLLDRSVVRALVLSTVANGLTALGDLTKVNIYVWAKTRLLLLLDWPEHPENSRSVLLAKTNNYDNKIVGADDFHGLNIHKCFQLFHKSFHPALHSCSPPSVLEGHQRSWGSTHFPRNVAWILIFHIVLHILHGVPSPWFSSLHRPFCNFLTHPHDVRPGFDSLLSRDHIHTGPHLPSLTSYSIV